MTRLFLLTVAWTAAVLIGLIALIAAVDAVVRTVRGRG